MIPTVDQKKLEALPTERLQFIVSMINAQIKYGRTNQGQRQEMQFYLFAVERELAARRKRAEGLERKRRGGGK